MIRALVACYTAGEQTPALSRAFGISESGVRELLRAEGVTLRGHAMTAQEVETALRLYACGLMITQVAAQVGYSYSAIWRVIRRHGEATTSASPGKRVVQEE